MPLQKNLLDVSIFKDLSGTLAIHVKVEKESVWLSLNQLSELFERDKSVISKHLKGIFETQELERESTVANFATVQNEAGKQVKRSIEYYNLDAIISVGYRVNSKRGIEFRKWATNVLKEYLLKGYTLNQKRLFETRLTDLEKSLRLLSRTLDKNAALAHPSIQIIESYAHSWKLLLEYDEDRLSLPEKTTKPIKRLDYEEALEAIQNLHQEISKKREKAPSLFGQEKGNGLQAVLGSIEQTFGGEELYKSCEEKAAHLLYFIIKDHPFNDGNKRIGCMLFLLYLRLNQVSLEKINESTLVALALLVAESHPKEKDLVIKLILNLI